MRRRAARRIVRPSLPVEHRFAARQALPPGLVEGLTSGKPVLDWQGRPYDPARGPAAHPNSRFTVSARRNPGYSPHAEDACGVPISALVFGGRRREVAPLVYEARDWRHGV